MKILFLNTNIGYGGASKMMVDIANSLSNKHQVDVLTFRESSVLQPLGEKVNHTHDPLYECKIKGIEIVGQIVKLRKYLKKNSYDLAIAFLHPSNYMLTLATKGTKTKVLLSERGDPQSRKKNGGLFVRFVEFILYHADAYVFQSNGAKMLYPVKCQKKGIVIANSIPDIISAKKRVGGCEKRIVHVARMEIVQKRQDIMVKAFNIFVKEFPEYVLEFYGDGPDMEKVKNLVDEFGLGENVVFKGATRDVINHIVNSTMFVLTSDYEGLPNALLEAMAVGIPCISTDCSPGGARMIINNGENGFIVPREDYLLLAQRMKDLALDENKRTLFSKNAIKIKDKFLPEKIYKDWENFIMKI